MGKRDDQAKAARLVERLEALTKCREVAARKEREKANASLPSDKEEYVIKYDELEPSTSHRSPDEALDWVSKHPVTCDACLLTDVVLI